MPAANESEATPLGRLDVVCGPMFAGKTTRLIALLIEAQDAGMSVTAVKPALDDRYHPTDLSTHTGIALPARTINQPSELTEIHSEVVGLDEAHFFDQDLHDSIMHLVRRGTRVIVAGLDRTSMNEPFGEMAALLIEADSVEKLTAPCDICGQPAVHTIRLFDSKESIVVGGKGMFENRCRTHLDDPKPAARHA